MVSISAFAIGTDLPAGITLSRTSLLFSLATAVIQKSFKIFTVKQQKRNAIKLSAQSKLYSLAEIISQAMQDRDISSIEFYKLLQEDEEYRKLNVNIRNKAKAKVKRSLKNSKKNCLNKEENKAKKFYY